MMTSGSQHTDGHRPRGGASASSGSQYDEKMVRLMNDRRGASLHATQSRRRSFVAAHVVLTLAALPLAAVAAGEGRLWPLVVILVMLPVWMFVTGVLNLATRGLLELRPRVLDERQLAERARVYAVVHRVFLGVMLATLGGLLVASKKSDAVDGPLLSTVLIGLLAVHWLLPLWTAGVTQRDEPADDVDPVGLPDAAHGDA